MKGKKYRYHFKYLFIIFVAIISFILVTNLSKIVTKYSIPSSEVTNSGQ